MGEKARYCLHYWNIYGVTHMSMCCVFISGLCGLWSYFLQGTFFFFNLDFPKKDPLKFYDWISNMVVSKVNIYQLTEGKNKQYIQPLFKNFRKIMNSLILVP